MEYSFRSFNSDLFIGNTVTSLQSFRTQTTRDEIEP